MKHKSTIILALTVAALLVVAGCTQSSNDLVQGSAEQVLAVNAAPSFTVQTTEGRTVSTEQNIQEGKPMVVYFMASTCTSCAKNWKNIDQVYPEYKDKVDLIAVSVDPTDDAQVLRKLSSDRGFTFETVPGNPQLAVKYEVSKQTAKFAIDKEGNIVSRHDGVLSVEEWRAMFESVV